MRRLGAVVMLLALLAGCGGAVARAAQPRSRVLQLSRGDRQLTTTIWAPPDARKHPIVLFSHGLGGLPEQFAPIAATWVAAGFVVVAPAYPHTNGKVKVDAIDVRHQPADAEFVLHALAGDPQADLTRVIAVGFSAGGTTTLGLLHAGRFPGLIAAVSIAGRRPPTPFGGSPVPVLFVHGDRDPTVPISAGRAAYAALRWPGKDFVTIPGGRHGDYLNPANPAYPRAEATIRDFLTHAVTASAAHAH
jgi:dienelactone hydrolase